MSLQDFNADVLLTKRSEGWCLTVLDRKSRIRLLELHLSHEDFSKVMGSQQWEVEGKLLNPSLILEKFGKTKENKQELVEYSKPAGFVPPKTHFAIVRQAAKKFEVDGWVLVDKEWNHRHSVNRGVYNCTFFRWVD